MNFLKNKSIFYLLSDDNSCNLQTNFNKSIHFDEPVECALLELILPNKLYRSDQLNFLQITGEFEWMDIESKNSEDQTLFESIQGFDLKPQTISKRFDLKSDKDLKKSIREIVVEINDWAKTIVLRANPYDWWVDFPEDLLLDQNLDFQNLFNPLKIITNNNNKLILKNAGKFDFLYRQFKQQTEDQQLPYSYTIKPIAKFNIKFNDKLKNLLGIMNLNLDQLDEIEFNPVENFDEKTNNYLFVHCDGVINSYLNDKKTNLLRVIPIKKNEQSEMTIYKFEKPIFIPMSVNELDSLKITIRDEENKDLFFTDGKLLATLILRPIREF